MRDTQDGLRQSLIATGVPEAKLAEAQKQNPEAVFGVEAFREQFEALGFLAPFVSVRRRSDGVTGMMMFTHHPRFYFNFVALDELKP